MDYIKRQNRLKKLLETKSLDAFLVKKRQNISYLVGTKGEDSILFFSGKKNFLITHSKCKEQYAKGIRNCYLRLIRDEDVYGSVRDVLKETRSKSVGFESNNFSYSEYAALKRKVNNIGLIPLEGLVESLRMIKDNDEIDCIKKACKYGCSVMNYAVKSLRESLSENTIKNRIEHYIAKNGLKKADFDIIVASGGNASMPHAVSSKKNLKKGEMVIIDLGATHYDYNSDLTRTAFLGRIDRKYLRIYNIVLDAERLAIEHLKPGIQAGYIDNISRQYINKKGLGKYFIHNLGHGVGLEIHERPVVSSKSSTVIEKNMVMTIEPGVYIPGWGGVRIEDTILVTEKGCKVLTDASKK